MVRHENEDVVTYTVVITPAQDGTLSDTLQIKMRKGGSPRSYLQWSCELQGLAKKKGWNDDQKSRSVIALVEGYLARDADTLVAHAQGEK